MGGGVNQSNNNTLDLQLFSNVSNPYTFTLEGNYNINANTISISDSIINTYTGDGILKLIKQTQQKDVQKEASWDLDTGGLILTCKITTVIVFLYKVAAFVFEYNYSKRTMERFRHFWIKNSSICDMSRYYRNE